MASVTRLRPEVTGFRPGRARDRGLVTIELAVSLLAALTLMIMFGWAALVVITQLRCIDGATEIARQQARGDKAAVVQAKQKLPAGAVVSLDRRAAEVTVRIETEVRPVFTGLPGIDVHAQAVAVTEPGEELP